MLEQIAESYEWGGVKYIDVGTKMMDEDGDLDGRYTFDGVHLNGEGYKVWIDTVREYVEK